MTSKASREHEQDQCRLAAEYNQAATAHDQAAQMHERIAAHYDKHRKAARATHERRKAAQERRSAMADRKCVATLTAETGISSEESDGPEPYGADLAALLGATIAVVLTLANSPGAWGPLSTIIGSLLLVVLLAFFWKRRPKAGQPRKWGLIFIGCALSVIVGLVAVITFAAAIQWRWFRDDTGYNDCRAYAAAQAAMSVHDLSDTDPRASNLSQLVGDALTYGSTGWRNVEDTPLKDAFYMAYYNDVGDCRAGDTMNSLWGEGVAFGLLALAWWNWSYIWNYYIKRLTRRIRNYIKRLSVGMVHHVPDS